MRVPPLHLTMEEAVVLLMLVGVGGTAFDMPVGFAHTLRQRFEREFGVTIDDADIVKIMNKVSDLIKKPGTETVVIDD